MRVMRSFKSPTRELSIYIDGNNYNSKGYLTSVCKKGWSYKQNYNIHSQPKFVPENSNGNINSDAITDNLSDTFLT